MSRKSDTGQYSLGDYQLQEVNVRLCFTVRLPYLILKLPVT